MVVEGTVSPVAAVVGHRIGPLPVHLGYHGLLLFLEEMKIQSIYQMYSLHVEENLWFRPIKDKLYLQILHLSPG